MEYRAFRNACMRAFRYVRDHIVPNPKTRYLLDSNGLFIGSTGNMALNALKYEWLDGGATFHMWIDEEIAPYVFYTNEPWTSPRWHGKKNPNEGWWNTTMGTFYAKLEEYLGGEPA